MVEPALSLTSGRREALVVLAEQLAGEIRACPTTRDRLPTVRAFLATLTALESIDLAAQREARIAALRAPSGPTEGPGNPVADLLAHRKTRRGRATG